VSGNSQGMTARVRWVRSRDRCALLVVHDPTAIENDPLPNAFAFVSEWGPIVVRRDSVWDVAPDPAWERLAFSRAYVVSAGGRDSLSAAEWQLLARRSGMSVEDVRRAAFPTSGMAMAYGIARPAVLDVRGARGDSADRRRADGIASPAGAARDTVERLLPLLGGWRLGWTRDGRALAVGGAPRTTYDDAPSVEWQMVDPSTGATIGPSPGPAPLPAGDTLAAVRWREGPVLDISVPVDLSRRRGLSTAGYRIETRDGWIHLTAPGTRRGAASRIIGPGVALATTTHARFIVALVPREKAREFDAPLELVVYQVGE